MTIRREIEQRVLLVVVLSWYRANAKINCCFSALVQVIRKSGKEGFCLPVALEEPFLDHSACTSG